MGIAPDFPLRKGDLVSMECEVTYTLTLDHEVGGSAYRLGLRPVGSYQDISVGRDVATFVRPLLEEGDAVRARLADGSPVEGRVVAVHARWAVIEPLGGGAPVVVPSAEVTRAEDDGDEPESGTAHGSYLGLQGGDLPAASGREAA